MAKKGHKNPNAGRKQFDGKPEALVIAKLEEVWGYGGSDAEAAFFAGIDKSTLSRYLDAHPEISQRRDALREKPVLEIRRCVVDGAKADPELGLKYLERVRRHEFSTRTEVEHHDKTMEQLLEEANKKEGSK